jgi:hypothetical protein
VCPPTGSSTPYLGRGSPLDHRVEQPVFPVVLDREAVPASVDVDHEVAGRIRDHGFGKPAREYRDSPGTWKQVCRANIALAEQPSEVEHRGQVFDADPINDLHGSTEVLHRVAWDVLKDRSLSLGPDDPRAIIGTVLREREERPAG